MAKQLLQALAPSMRRHKAVLAGGTAAALHIGHRISTDFDFFTLQRFDSKALLRDLARLGKAEVELAKSNSVIVHYPESKFSLFRLPYRFVKTHPYKGVDVASLEDIAAIKLAAITQRGVRRDFVDLYYILQDMPFRKAAGALKAKYGSIISAITIGKAMVYFDEAEDSPDCAFIGKGVDWKTVKRFFEKNVRQFVLDLQNEYDADEEIAEG